MKVSTCVSTVDSQQHSCSSNSIILNGVGLKQYSIFHSRPGLNSCTPKMITPQMIGRQTSPSRCIIPKASVTRIYKSVIRTILRSFSSVGSSYCVYSPRRWNSILTSSTLAQYSMPFSMVDYRLLVWYFYVSIYRGIFQSSFCQLIVSPEHK